LGGLSNNAVASAILGLVLGLGSGAPRQADTPGNGLIAYADRPGGQFGPEHDGAQIMTLDPETGDKQQLTDSAGGNMLPAWSPDGTKLAFVSTRTGAPEIWVMNADGSDQRQLTLGGGAMLPAWSPDSSQIACSVRGQIWVIGADGSYPRQLTTAGHNNVATWSPDGKRIAIWNGNPRGFGQIWTIGSDGGDAKQLTFPRTDDYTPAGSSANAPAWLHNQRIAYWSGIEHRYGHIWTMNADGSDQRKLTDDPAPVSNDNPAWSPDGKQILFDTSRRGRPEIWVMDADGGNQRPMVSNPRVVPARPSWQPVFGE